MYSHDKTFSKCNLFYTLHLVPKCHKCSIVGPFMVHDNFKFRKLCCVTFLQIVERKLCVFLGQKPFLPDDFTTPKHVKISSAWCTWVLWKTKAIYSMYQTAQNVVIQYICTFDLFHEARVFCKKVLIESEKRLDFIGALICNIKVRLNSATNFVIHWKTIFWKLLPLNWLGKFDWIVYCLMLKIFQGRNWQKEWWLFGIYK